MWSASLLKVYYLSVSTEEQNIRQVEGYIVQSSTTYRFILSACPCSGNLHKLNMRTILGSASENLFPFSCEYLVTLSTKYYLSLCFLSLNYSPVLLCKDSAGTILIASNMEHPKKPCTLLAGWSTRKYEEFEFPQAE